MSRNTLRVMCLSIIIPLPHGSAILLTYQQTACVARTCRHPCRHLSTPTEEYCETSTAPYGSDRISPTCHIGNASRAAPLRTEPTRTLWWKRAIVPCFHRAARLVCIGVFQHQKLGRVLFSVLFRWSSKRSERVPENRTAKPYRTAQWKQGCVV